MNQFAAEWLVGLPTYPDLVLRLTAVLSVAWIAQYCLKMSNPRWQVYLWRLASAACFAIAIATLLPKLAINVVPPEPPPSTSQVLFDEPAFGGGVFANGAEAEKYHQEDFRGLRRHGRDDAVTPQSRVVQSSQKDTPRTVPASRWVEYWHVFAAVAWLIGASLLAVRWTKAQWRLRQLLSRSIAAPEACRVTLDQVARDLGLVAQVEVLLSDETDVPFVAGNRKPTIVLPSRMSTPEFHSELPAIFAHELTHVQSHDLIWMGIVQWLSIPLWFHPLAWRMPSAHSMACEEVADAVAAGNVGDTVRYSGILARVALSAVSHPPTTVALSMARSPEIMSRLERLKLGLSDSPLTRRRVALFLLTGLLMLAPITGLELGFAAPGSSIRDEYGATDRVLEFPADFPVGELSIATELENEWWDRHAKRFDYRRDWEWKPFGLAQGRVAIPVGAKVRLSLMSLGARDMTWVNKLPPDAFHEIYIYPHPSGNNPYAFGDGHARHLAHFSELKKLEMGFVQVTDRGMRHLESMKSLEVLLLYSPEMGNGGLRSIGRMSALEMLSLGKMRWTDAGLVHLAGLRSLEEINLPHPGTPGRGFDTVLSLPKLRQITTGASFTDEHLARLGKAKSLTALDLSQCQGITDEGLVHLANVPHLEYLNFFHTNITDAGVRHLRPLRSLKHLHLRVNRYHPDSRDPTITVKSAKILAGMPSLETLEFSSTAGGDEFLMHISRLQTLTRLAVGGTRSHGLFSDQGAEYIAQLNKLERLSLVGTTITDQGMESLSQLTNLSYLYFGSDEFTDEGLAKLTSLKELRYLSLACSRKRKKITFSGVSRLGGLTSLEELWYPGWQARPNEQALDFSGLPNLQKFSMGGIRDKDLVSLADCRNLKWLQIGFDSHLSDEGLAHLAGLTSMERLLISGDGITDAGMASLADMDKLKSLTVVGNLTDAGLRHIGKLNSLVSLRIQTENRFSQNEIEYLQSCLPNLYSFNIDQDRAAPSATPATLQVGQPAPPFQIKTLEGRQLTNQNYRGKVLLLYFWSTTCPPCVASMPKTKESHAQLSKYDDFAMISLSGDANEATMRNFIRKHRWDWPQARIGSDSKLADSYGVTGYPTYILVGRDGKILCVDKGKLNEALYKALDIKDDT